MTMNCPPPHNLQPHGPPSTMPDQQPITWILTDGTAGMRIQCLGLAKAAGLTPIVKHIHPSLLLRALPSLGLLPGMAASAGGDPIEAPWPDVVISCGRRTAGAALAVRRLSGGRDRKSVV